VAKIQQEWLTHLNLKSAAINYAEEGFRVFQCLPNKKVAPKNLSWPDVATTDIEQIEKWWDEKPNYNIGLIPPPGIVVVDIDLSEKKGKNGFQSLSHVELGETLKATTPNGGVHLFYQYDTDMYEIKAKSENVNGLKGVDIRAGIVNEEDGPGYVVGAPSHYVPSADEMANGKIEGDYQLSAPFDIYEIMPLPDSLGEALQRTDKEPKKKYSCSENTDVDREEIKRALDWIDPNLDHCDWIKIGFACDSVGCFDLWDEWSAQSPMYKEKEIEEKRKYAGRKSGITVATLFHYAIEHSRGEYCPPVNDKIPESEGPVPEYKEIKAQDSKAFSESRLCEMIDNLPPIALELIHEINKCSPYKHPAIEVATVLSCFSAPLVRRFVTSQMNTSCLDMLAIAETGEGKEVIRSFMSMFTGLSPNAKMWGSSRPNSSFALFHHLADNGALIAFGDEEGLQRQGQAQKKDGHSTSVKAYMMEIMGRRVILKNDNGEFFTDGMSRLGKKTEEIDMIETAIYKPMIHRTSTTTMATLKDTVDMSALSSGEFNRKIVVGSQPRKGIPSIEFPSPHIPPSVQAWIMDIKKMADGAHTGTKDPKIIVIPFPKDYKEAFMPIRLWQADKKEELLEQGLSGCVSRSTEKAMKLSLVLTLMNDPYAKEIAHWAIDWAMEFVIWADGGVVETLGQSAQITGTPAEDEEEMLTKIIAKYNKKKEPLTGREAYKTMKGMPADTAKKIIRSLEDKGLLHIGKGKRKDMILITPVVEE
jgi:hypothetical protein